MESVPSWHTVLLDGAAVARTQGSVGPLPGRGGGAGIDKEDPGPLGSDIRLPGSSVSFA